jgi:ABC-type Na+ efflux pump permease subunit
MSPIVALLIIGVATAVAVAAMLLVRRHAPEGSFFADGDRAAGGFGVLATGFSVLLGLIVFLAFTSYDDSRSGAETEALAVGQQFETAQFLPADVRGELGDELVCYARSIVYGEWPALEAGTQGDAVNPWAVSLFRTLKTTNPQTNAEQSAYDQWLDHTADREEARRDRIHGAVGVIPGPLWFVLLFIALIIFAYTLFFADSGERAKSQAMLMGSVVAVIAAMLLLIQFLDDPYRGGLGSLQPVAMERTLGILEQERNLTGETGALPCEADGEPVEGPATG